MPLQTMSYWIALMRQELVVVVRIEREEFLDAQVRHRERVVREVDLLLFLVPFVHREVDDPAEVEAVLGDQAELLADLGARGAGELDEVLRLAGDEEAGVADAELRADRRSAWCAPARCSWRAGLRRPPRLRARRCSRGPAGPRLAPRSSCGRRRRGCRPSAPGSPTPRCLGSFARMLAKILKPEPRNASLTSCITIGLRRSGLSVPYFDIASA